MNQIAGITDWYVMPDISAGITFGRVVAPRFGLPADEARIAAAIPRARVCVDELSRLLGDQTFMAGEAVTIADLMLIPHMAFLDEATEGETLLGPHPNLRGWIARMGARPSARATTWDALLATA